MDIQLDNRVAAFISIVGMPNVGKSTLTNTIMQQKLSIVTPKAQTTRYATKAIYNDKEAQLIFIDTPGVLKEQYLMHTKMMRELNHAIQSADVLAFMFDAAHSSEAEIKNISTFKKKSQPHVTLINKVDIVAKKTVDNLRGRLQELGYGNILALSASNAKMVDPLIVLLKKMAPHLHPFFDDDEQLSDRNVRFFCAEFIREKCYLFLQKEIPYEVAVVVEAFKEEKEIIYIYAYVIVARDSQKKIVIGEKGSKIQQIGTQARHMMENFLGKKIFLDLRVKVRKDWRKKGHYLKEYGFNR